VGGSPLATRNFQQLLTLSTGASSSLNNSEQLGRGTVAINVNGQREDNSNYLIDQKLFAQRASESSFHR
jgi:hypothetical protein